MIRWRIYHDFRDLLRIPVKRPFVYRSGVLVLLCLNPVLCSVLLPQRLARFENCRLRIVRGWEALPKVDTSVELCKLPGCQDLVSQCAIAARQEGHESVLPTFSSAWYELRSWLVEYAREPDARSWRIRSQQDHI
jgi:hypothetical protein